MKTNKLKLAGFVLVIMMAGFLVVCNTVQQDRPMPAWQTTDELDANIPAPIPLKCDHLGSVVKMPNEDDYCGLSIMLDDGDVLFPYSMMVPFDFEEGQRISVSYDQLDVVVPGCKGKPVAIYCVELLPEDPPQYFCVNRGIIHYSDCGILIEVVADGRLFQPLNLENDWSEGSEVLFGYQEVEVEETPCGGIPIITTCIK